MKRVLPLLLGVLLAGAACQKSAEAPGAAPTPLDRSPAPELSGGSAWLNTDRPLRLKQELKGRVVLIDFWTYCCINCMQTFPALKRVEAKFAGQPFQVLGVHSAKFDDEKDASHIQSAMERAGIQHPVLVDSDFAVWKAYGVQGWPTLVLIDAEGNRVVQQSGEPDAAELETLIARLLKEGKQRGTLASGPPDFKKPQQKDTGPLAFPGKVTALDGDRIAVADSGHHRIIVARADGTVLATVGSGLEGFSDGAFEDASFRRPQGIAGSGSILYVADTENHAIRRIDLDAKTVTTVAGTGKRGEQSREMNADPLKTALRSPWDVALNQDGDALFIAMAGSHQLWKLDLKDGKLGWFTGSGDENLKDGPAADAQLAQPSGLALSADGEWLYFADSEDSSLRRARLSDGRVETLVGKGLFEFGSVDGAARNARFQHPLGVALLGEKLYVADTFNNQVRAYSLAKKTVESVTSHSGASLSEPGGIAVVNGRLLVADTNHHRLAWVDLKTGVADTLVLKGLAAPVVQGVKAEVATGPRAALPSVGVGEGALARGDSTLTLQLSIPDGYELNEEAPQRVKLDLSGAQGVKAGAEAPLGKAPSALTAHFPLSVADQAGGELAFDVNVYFCEARKKSQCLLSRERLAYALKGPSGSGQKSVTLLHSVHVMVHSN